MTHYTTLFAEISTPVLAVPANSNRVHHQLPSRPAL